MKKTIFTFVFFVLVAFGIPFQVAAQKRTVMLDNCDEIGTEPNQWIGVGDIYINSADHKEGNGCLETTGDSGADKFSRVFADPVDVTLGGEIEEEDAVLKFWMYISDISLFNATAGQVELGSGGAPDRNEWNWLVNKADLKAGWNEYKFDLSDHGGTGGQIDLTAVNWFRIYKHLDTSDEDAANAIVYRLDDIRIEGNAKPQVNIENFQVLQEDGKINITWETTKESNCEYFLIEKALNSGNFAELIRITPEGGREAHAYRYTDENAGTGANYYRLSYFTDEGEQYSLGSSFAYLPGEDKRSIVGKVITGYQAWFNCYGDGSPVARWAHWSGGRYNTNQGLPAPGYLSFEVYPDISEYPESSLFQTGFADLVEGKPATLFSSYKEDVIEKHFEWMQSYGIDGAALQRFLGETSDPVFKRNRDSIAVRVKAAAEKYERLYYIMYDMDATSPSYFKTDWEHMENDLEITDSPYYAHQDGKPVICIWGLGFNHRSNDVENSIEILSYLKEKGYYIIGGVPTNWRTSSGDSHPGYENVYSMFDMISPWTVGRYGNINEINNFRDNFVIPDFEYCRARGQEYQPVIFCGFAWSNWNSNRVNEIPRNRGESLWQQVCNIKTAGIPNLYLAMFDEYDEGTNFMKAADSYLAIPRDQYFLTNSADGTYLSSDFYLRLAGKAVRTLKGTEAWTQTPSVPYSEGPHWFRTSLEKGYDAVFTTTSRPGETENNVDLQCAVIRKEESHNGEYAVKYTGNNITGENQQTTVGIFDVEIPVNENTKLGYWIYPVNENGRYASLDLRMSDGSLLSDIMEEPSFPYGDVEAWNGYMVEIGKYLPGKTIEKICVTYSGTPEVGEFSGYIDDIVITDTDSPLVLTSAVHKPLAGQGGEKDILLYPTLITDGIFYLDTSLINGSQLLKITIGNLQGMKVSETHLVAGGLKEVPVPDLSSGLYLVTISGKDWKINKKIIVR